jgi:hypothetical protein
MSPQKLDNDRNTVKTSLADQQPSARFLAHQSGFARTLIFGIRQNEVKAKADHNSDPLLRAGGECLVAGRGLQFSRFQIHRPGQSPSEILKDLPSKTTIVYECHL